MCMCRRPPTHTHTPVHHPETRHALGSYWLFHLIYIFRFNTLQLSQNYFTIWICYRMQVLIHSQTQNANWHEDVHIQHEEKTSRVYFSPKWLNAHLAAYTVEILHTKAEELHIMWLFPSQTLMSCPVKILLRFLHHKNVIVMISWIFLPSPNKKIR